MVNSSWLDQRTSMGVIGDLRAYHAYQMASAIPDAATNPAGGIAGAGMGLGMGMAMAGPMLTGAGGMPGGGTQAPPPPPQLWHLAENGQSVGPMAPQQLAEAVSAAAAAAAAAVAAVPVLAAAGRSTRQQP